MRYGLRIASLSQHATAAPLAPSFWLWPGAVNGITLPHMDKTSFDDQETPQETRSPATKRRRWPFGTIGMVVLTLAVVAGVWTAYWLYMVDRVEKGIDDWIANQQRQGVRFSYESLEVSGFPFWLNVRMEGASMLLERGQSWEWRPPVLAASIRPWRLTEIDVDLSGSHQFVGARRVNLMSRKLGAVIHVQGRGAWRGTLKGEGVSAEFSRVGTLSAKRVALNVHWGGNRLAAGQSPLRLDLDGDNIEVPAAWSLPLGRGVAKLRLAAYVAGPLKLLRDRDVLVRWRDDGGTLELSRLSLEYGPLLVDGDGTFALDDDLQPMGTFVARAEGLMETLDALRLRNMIGIGQATAVKLMLMVLAHQSAGGPPRLEAPLTLQDREVTLKSLPIMKVPRIDWSRVIRQRPP